MFRVLHIVRRFGPVGGMERYVWRLTHELCELGVHVEVLCETVEGAVDQRVRVHQISPSVERRRWKAMRNFRNSCTAFWADYPERSNVIVHSHERCTFHHVTTFHGPPVGQSLLNMPWWKRLQPRLKAWANFEEAELCGLQVKAVIPVSARIGDALEKSYPNVTCRLKASGWPGIDLTDKKRNISNGYKLLFVGREWKRKGLDIAISAYLRVKEREPLVTLDIFGVSESEVPRWLRIKDQGITFNSWKSVIPFELYDVLIHPAREEPFGMVVPEARAAGLFVVMSNKVGATDLSLSGVQEIDIDADTSSWSQAIVDTLGLSKLDPEVCWTWQDLAKWHIFELYAVL